MNFMTYGNDRRIATVAELLESDGHTRTVPADLMILAPREPFAQHANDGRAGCAVYGGRPIDRDAIQNAGFQLLKQSDTYHRRNSIFTAEGAAAIAIKELPIALCECQVLLLGYGFLGRACANLFKKLGSAVTVCTAAESELHDAMDKDFRVLPLSSLRELSWPLIINTIPAPVLSNKELLLNLEGTYPGLPAPLRPLLLELASIPCCEEDATLFEVLVLKSVPAGFSPISAANLMFHDIKQSFSH